MKSLFLLLALLLAPALYASCDVSVSLCDDAVTSAKIDDDSIMSADINSAAGITLGQMSVQALKSVDVTITAAQLDTLNATPISLLAAGGAGTINIVDSVVCFVDFVATRLELGSGTLDIKYTDSSGAAVATAIPNTTAELNADTYYHSVGLAVVPVANAAVVIHASADVTSGDSILKCRTHYRTITVSDI